MVTKPPVFISATSDLRSARDLVGRVLHSMGYEPRWQDIAPVDGGPMLDVLRRWIDPCPLVIQLVGDRYGAEPPTPTAEFGRVSYTQFEARYAESKGKKVIYHFLDSTFPRDPASEEPQALRQLQADYRQSLIDANRLRHDRIESTQALELSIHNIGHELERLRKVSDRRYRRLLMVGCAALVALAAIGAAVFHIMHRQAQTQQTVVDSSKQVKDELAEMRKELQAAVSPKPLASGESGSAPLSPELLAKAQILLERGNKEDQALAKIALRQHEEADKIIQDLKSKPGNPIDEAFRLLTLEGDNWYQADQPDRAIEPFEKAMALKPRDGTARNNLTIALTFARIGSIAGHKNQAIEIAQGTLKLIPAGSQDWAWTQNNFGNAWQTLPTGDRAENLKMAIDAYEQALTVYTRQADPGNWAMTQNNLGVAWVDVPTVEGAENLKKAIAAFDAALTVYTRQADPTHWAMTQNNLANAWWSQPAGDRAQNLKKAIAAYEAALTVYTRQADPGKWAAIQGNLANAWSEVPTGDRTENLKKAIAAHEAALTVFTRDADPSDWAMTHYNLAMAYGDVAEQPNADRGAWLAKAIASGKAALLIRTESAYPRDHNDTLKNLNIDRRAYESTPAAATRPFDSIPAAE